MVENTIKTVAKARAAGLSLPRKTRINTHNWFEEALTKQITHYETTIRSNSVWLDNLSKAIIDSTVREALLETALTDYRYNE